MKPWLTLKFLMNHAGNTPSGDKLYQMGPNLYNYSNFQTESQEGSEVQAVYRYNQHHYDQFGFMRVFHPTAL